MLTREQKRAILNYVSGYSIKAILEDVDEVGQTWTEENDDQLRAEIERFLDERDAAVKEWFNNEHS